VGAAIGEILGTAVGVAISPPPIIALIVILFSSRAKANGLSFVAGWLSGLALEGGILLVIGSQASDAGEVDSSGWISLAMGLAFLLLAWQQWSSRPPEGEDRPMPGWMASISELSAARSFVMAFLFAAVLPKNIALTISAAASISAAGLDSSEEFIVLGVFVLISSVTVLAPVIWYFVSPESAQVQLGVIKDWLVVNANTVMTVLFLVLGAKMLGDGIAGLS